MKRTPEADISGLSARDLTYLDSILTHINEDGYFMIKTIRKYKDIDIILASIYGKEPLSVVKYNAIIKANMLRPLTQIIDGKVSYNYTIKDNRLFIPTDGIMQEVFDCEFDDVLSIEEVSGMCQNTPISILWLLVKNNYGFIWPGSEVVPANRMYFGLDDFSVRVDVKIKGEKVTKILMKFVDGEYIYEDINAVDLTLQKNTVSSLKQYGESEEKGASFLSNMEKTVISDDLGRDRIAYKIKLSNYELSMLDQRRFKAVYHEDYSLAILDRLYCMSSYLDGVKSCLATYDKSVSMLSLPFKPNSAFDIRSDVQVNSFEIKPLAYSAEMYSDILGILQQEDLSQLKMEYLRHKDNNVRETIYKSIVNKVGVKYGYLTHYYINGILDGLAIQKGDERVRIKILDGYINTVNKEFLMYALYYYDLRTMFLRNTNRIQSTFQSVVVLDNYNGRYFVAG